MEYTPARNALGSGILHSRGYVKGNVARVCKNFPQGTSGA